MPSARSLVAPACALTMLFAPPTPAEGPAADAGPARGPAAAPDAPAPFAFADFTWLNGNARTRDAPLDTKAFTGELRVDTSYIFHFAHPADHTLSGTSESGRTDEFQVQHLGVGGDFHHDNVQARVMTQFGMYSTMTPRNDASPTVGQWDLATAYRYVSEAYGGYHFNVWNGINLQAGIFMSYVGLFSYYSFDNWAYQPSYVSSNTPWFFNGLRVQIFPSDKLKIEPWLINGWQSYAKLNNRPGFGLQLLWRPTGSVSLLSNSYAYGTDTLGQPNRNRWHSDDSLQVKLYEDPSAFITRSAFSLTVDLGCENGGGVVCAGGTAGRPSQYFLGFMLYDRVWLDHDRFAVTVGGGAITNPGRYLVLVPPINGANAASNPDPRYFSFNPGDEFKAWDFSVTLDFMPSQFITFRAEYDRRGASVPYFSGANGMTPPGVGNTANGSQATVGAPGGFVDGWTPDLQKSEKRLNFALLVKL